MNKNKKNCITILITGDFDSFHRKPMILSLAKFIYPNPIIIINRPFNFIPNFFRKNKRIKKEKIIKIENIYILNSSLFIHDKLALFLPNSIKKINFLLFKKDINILLEDLNINNNILYIMHPELQDYISVINNNKVIYDCYDEFITNKALKGIKIREKDLIKKSDLIITSSRYLKEKKEKLYSINNIIFSSTAISKNDFQGNINIINKLNNKLLDSISNKLKINKPIVGFAGSIRDDINLEILEFLIKNRPNYIFIFLGTIYNIEVFNKLNLFENAIFLGGKNFKEFISYLDLFHVSIMPHILNDFILSSSPYKFYQYLASSSYIVSSPIPEVVDFEKTELGKKKVAVAYSKEEFLEKIDNFINKPKEYLTQDELNSISWEARFENIKDFLY
ncbi:MAG: hypothetical protein U0457_14580 [Candidatus Sericytochromatia bacterium]